MKIPSDSWKQTHGCQLGITYEQTEPGRTVASLQVGPQHCNPVGVCHGGVIFALADDSMGGALHPLCPEGKLLTSAQVNVHYVSSARPGDCLRVESRVTNRTRRTALVESRVNGRDDRLVALLTATYLFVEPRYATTE